MNNGLDNKENAEKVSATKEICAAKVSDTNVTADKETAPKQIVAEGNVRVQKKRPYRHPRHLTWQEEEGYFDDEEE